LKVGLTGGIGSGKSTVAEIFRKLGAVVLSADKIARELTEKDPRVKTQIREAFGPQVFTPRGSIDRRAVASIIFSDQRKREKLNSIIHPLVLSTISALMGDLEKRNDVPLIIHEAALIYEAEAEQDLDYVVVVDADEETRIRRVMERDRVSRADVLLRINAQLPAEEKRARADFVINNDDDHKSLEVRVKFLYDLFLKIGEPSGAPDC
jgi:dephospho-CoA kinase